MQREAFGSGFSAALGTAACLVLLYLSWHFLSAAAEVATPFIFGIIVAIMLNPLVDRIQRGVRVLRGKRILAVALVFILFLLIFGTTLTFLIPALIDQGTTLVQEFPGYVQSVRKLANSYLASHQAIGPVKLPPNIEAITTQYSDQLDTYLRTAGTRAARIAIGSLAGLLSVVLVPIITLYVLIDIDRLRARLFYLMPSHYRPQIMRAATDVGSVFSSYVRGMVTLSVAYGIVATVIFFLFGLKSYALLLGFAAGLLYAIPFIGPFVTALLACIVSLATGHTVGHTAILLGVVLLQNQAFDNLVVPRVVGQSVGLNPILTMFALFLGGEMFGLWGMLLSVPVAASVQIILFRVFPKLSAPTPISLMMPEERSVATEAGASEKKTETVDPV